MEFPHFANQTFYPFLLATKYTVSYMHTHISCGGLGGFEAIDDFFFMFMEQKRTIPFAHDAIDRNVSTWCGC